MVRTFTLLSLVTLVLLGLGGSVSLAKTKLDAIRPGLMGTNKSIVVPGEEVTFTVTLTGVATGDEIFTIDASSGSFISLPSTISPEPGATSVTFTGIVGLTLLEGIEVSVSDGEVCIPTVLLTWTGLHSNLR